MTATEKDFWKDIESYTPGKKGDDIRLIFADWLEEQGRLMLANCFRWCVKNDKHPRKWGDSIAVWIWYDRAAFQAERYGGYSQDEIPYEIFKYLKYLNSSMDDQGFASSYSCPTLHDAYMFLGYALERFEEETSRRKVLNV